MTSEDAELLLPTQRSLATAVASRLISEPSVVFLIGEPGSGRSTVLRLLQRDLAESGVSAAIVEYGKDFSSALPAVLLVEGLEKASLVEQADIAQACLAAMRSESKAVVTRFVVAMTPALRLAMTSDPLWGALDRMVEEIVVPALRLKESGQYLRHRLGLAGLRQGDILTSRGFAEIVRLSQGRPGRINVLLGSASRDQARLMAAGGKKALRLDRTMIRNTAGHPPQASVVAANFIGAGCGMALLGLAMVSHAVQNGQISLPGPVMAALQANAEDSLAALAQAAHNRFYPSQQAVAQVTPVPPPAEPPAPHGEKTAASSATQEATSLTFLPSRTTAEGAFETSMFPSSLLPKPASGLLASDMHIPSAVQAPRLASVPTPSEPTRIGQPDVGRPPVLTAASSLTPLLHLAPVASPEGFATVLPPEAPRLAGLVPKKPGPERLVLRLAPSVPQSVQAPVMPALPSLPSMAALASHGEKIALLAPPLTLRAAPVAPAAPLTSIRPVALPVAPSLTLTLPVTRLALHLPPAVPALIQLSQANAISRPQVAQAPLVPERIAKLALPAPVQVAARLPRPEAVPQPVVLDTSSSFQVMAHAIPRGVKRPVVQAASVVGREVIRNNDQTSSSPDKPYWCERAAPKNEAEATYIATQCKG